jgi:YHS domain-containing protein
MYRRIVFGISFGFIAAASLLSLGCGSSSAPPVAPPAGVPATAKADDESHGHKAGAHGGMLVSLGRDSYHAEAVFEKDGTIRLYMLGKDEARVQDVEVQDLAAYVTADGGTGSEKVVLRAEPQSGDAKGKTSLFVGSLPKELIGKRLQVTINNIAVNGERFRIAFSNGTREHVDAEMPAKRATEEEQALFFTPGGLYTADDIRKNGNTVPTVKYAGIRAQHDDNPKAGEWICPISKTKANPKFTWIVGGKTYQFCCVPCIEEFVALAKDKPGEIKDPSEYVKR